MFSINVIVPTILKMQISHLIWVPDSVMGHWESALEASSIPLIRVCREGEAWPLAAGLYAGGACPLVMMQSTGLFESGDALRNFVYDLKCPGYAWIGVRNWLNPTSADSARRFALPIVQAWDLDHVWVQGDQDMDAMLQHYHRCRLAQTFGLALWAEGAV
jgi:hypothetical protein